MPFIFERDNVGRVIKNNDPKPEMLRMCYRKPTDHFKLNDVFNKDYFAEKVCQRPHPELK